MSGDIAMRQIDESEVRRPLVPVGEASVRLRELVEQAGVAFQRDEDPGLPGPADTAAVELATGTQFAFEHHHSHPAGFVLVLTEPGDAAPADRVAELVSVIGIDADEFERVAEDWDVG